MLRSISMKENISLLLLRLWLGLNMAFAHGLGKVTDPSDFLDGDALEAFPAPIPMGWFAMIAEFVGGIFVAAGFLTRVSAIAIAGTMLGAAFVVHGGDPWSEKEFALSYAVMALVLVMRGGGQYTVRRFLQTQRERIASASASN